MMEREHHRRPKGRGGRRWAVTLTALATMAPVIGGLGVVATSQGNAAAAPARAEVATIHAMLPAKFRDGGVLNVADAPTYAPYDFATSKAADVGIDPDLFTAAAGILGIKYHYSNIEFTDVIPGIQAGRYDIAISSLGDSAEREKIVSFIDVYKGPYGLLVQKGNPHHVTTAMCGESVAVTTGSIDLANEQGLSKQCVTQGKKPITIKVFSENAATITAVESGQVEACDQAYAQVAYDALEDPGDLAVAPGTIPLAPGQATPNTGWAFAKNSTQLTKAFAAALNYMVKDGSYAKVLGKWHVSDTALPKIIIT